MADFFSSQYFPFLVLHSPHYKPELSIKGNKCQINRLMNERPDKPAIKYLYDMISKMSEHTYEHKKIIAGNTG